MESKLFATTLVVASIAAGNCSNAENQEKLHVGSNDWVSVVEPVEQKYSNSEKLMFAGEECAIDRGEELVLKNGKVKYENDNALGTECPDGSTVSVTPREAKAQDRSYQQFEARRESIADEIDDMNESDGKPAHAENNSVDVVNSSGVNQQFTNDTEELQYGDSCIASGTATTIGQLSTGENVIRVENDDQLGTDCPTGVLYLK